MEKIPAPTITDKSRKDLDNPVSLIYNKMLTLLVKSIIEPVVVNDYQVNSCQHLCTGYISI